MNKLFAPNQANDTVVVDDVSRSASDSFPLSLAQKRIWSLEQIGNSTVFPLQVLTLRWHSTVTLDQLQHALANWQNVIALCAHVFAVSPAGVSNNFQTWARFLR